MAIINGYAFDWSGGNAPLSQATGVDPATLSQESPVLTDDAKSAPDLNDLFPTGNLSQGYAI